MWLSLLATVWSPWCSCHSLPRNSFTLAGKDSNMTLRWKLLRTRRGKTGQISSPPQLDSRQCGGFAHWLASYQDQLEKLAKQPEHDRHLSKLHKGNV